MRVKRSADRRAEALERRVAELEQQIADITTWLHGLADHADLSNAFDLEMMLLGLPPRPVLP